MTETAFLAAYDALLARWPVAVGSVGVSSPYGTTRVHACGPHDAPPLLLLPGGGATSAVWFAIAAELAGRYRVYAPDLPGDAGRSAAQGRPPTTVADLLAWLDAVLDDLGLTTTHVCGHSYGGWIALTYALHAPNRVRRLALLDPTTCFAGMSPRYLLHASPLLVRPTAARMRAFLRWEIGGLPVDPGWLEVAALAAGLPRPRIVMPRRPRPADLRSATVPTLVLLAEQSRSHDIRRVDAAARQSMPAATTAILPGVSHHSLPTGNPDGLSRELLRFLAPAR